MTAEVRTEPIVHQRQIEASPETVFSFFTDPEKLTRWLAVEAMLDPRPGGICRQTHVGRNGDHHVMRGDFVEVSSPSRLVFSWGYESEGTDLPPGESTVEVTFEPRDGGTWLTLTHSGIPESQHAGHDEGWQTMLGRLATAVEQS